MRVLGVDPGLKATGYGLVECVGRTAGLLEAGTVEPNPRDSVQKKLATIHSSLGEIIDQFHPQVMILEKLYTHYQRPVIACIMGHARGVICLLCAQKNIELVEYPVKRIRKALTGNGSATKQQTLQMVAHTLKIDEGKLTMDASDALALALGYAQITGVP